MDSEQKNTKNEVSKSVSQNSQLSV